MLFECVRCTRLIKHEEIYYFMNRFYCHACMIFIECDPESMKLVKTQYKLDKILQENFRQIEN